MTCAVRGDLVTTLRSGTTRPCTITCDGRSIKDGNSKTSVTTRTRTTVKSRPSPREDAATRALFHAELDELKQLHLCDKCMGLGQLTREQLVRLVGAVVLSSSWHSGIRERWDVGCRAIATILSFDLGDISRVRSGTHVFVPHRVW